MNIVERFAILLHWDFLLSLVLSWIGFSSKGLGFILQMSIGLPGAIYMCLKISKEFIYPLISYIARKWKS